MTFIITAIMALIVVSILALAAGGAESPYRITTFHRTSPAELIFDRRTAYLRWIGYLCASLAAGAGVILVLFR
jgi:hypothetical protein